ncbi:hypothetical protein N1851_032004 [Merluccius polli]|uniref:Uncharacterized protein n=1 Tax=Merluccius polli TaxID=89951 RepID=A0AA47M3B7_MERPO|nr:hypothetical protein N1851_032004 [Merluccius polli]
MKPLAYTLLDTQSSHTFVDQEVCEKLQAAIEPVKLKLSTMIGKDSVVKSQRAYTRDFIPLERTHIPTCQTAKKWKHLVNMAEEIPPLMECGSANTKMGHHWWVTTSPTPLKPDSVWSIVGSVPQSVNAKDVTGLCHRTPNQVTKAYHKKIFRFLQILKGGIRQNEAWPPGDASSFKVRPHLPDNKKLALARVKAPQKEA